MPEQLYRTVPADLVAIVRSYPPMVAWFAAALAGIALVFDIFYLVASPGLALAAVYAVPVLAGLIAGLVAAADDLDLDRRVLGRTVVAAVALGITNIVVVAMISAMMRTDPSGWRAGLESVLLAGAVVLSVAVTTVVIGNLIDALGIELRTKWPRRRPVAVRSVPVDAVEKVRSSKEAAAGANLLVAMGGEPDGRAADGRGGAASEDVSAEDRYVAPSYLLQPRRVVDLEEPREVVPASEGTGHADRLSSRAARVPAVPRSRRTDRPGRRPGH